MSCWCCSPSPSFEAVSCFVCGRRGWLLFDIGWFVLLLISKAQQRIPLLLLSRNYFPKRPSGAPFHTLSKLYDVPVGFVPPSYFQAEYCLFCGRRRVTVARYRMICLVLSWFYSCLSEGTANFTTSFRTKVPYYNFFFPVYYGIFIS